MYLEELKKILKQEHILEKYQIDELCIFGSIARGENGNDIDLRAYELQSSLRCGT